MNSNLMRRAAKPMLFLAAFIWGTSFFIMKNTLDSTRCCGCSPSGSLWAPFCLGLFCWKRWGRSFTWDYVWRGAVLGTFLFTAYATQTFGLVDTTPSKNAFLTATYCVLVPFLYWAVARQRPDRYNILAALMCVTGVGLVSLTGDFTITRGDLLTLLSALFYTFHIVAVNKLSVNKGRLSYYCNAICLYSNLGPFRRTALPALPRRHLLSAPGSLPPAYLCVMCTTVACCSRTWARCGPTLLRLGDFVPGVGIRGAVLRAVLRRPRHPSPAGGLRADLCGGHLLGGPHLR